LITIVRGGLSLVTIFEIGKHCERPFADGAGSQRVRNALLLEHRRASLALARLPPPQAGGDRPGIGDIAGAEPIDVRGAGLALLERDLAGPLRGSRSLRQQREQETERRGPVGPVKRCRTSCKPCFHDRVSRLRLDLDKAGAITAKYAD
jgi:hypothetical protein